MNTKNLWISSLTGAVLTTLVSNLPFVGLVNCLLCGGFWGSAIFATWLYRRLTGILQVRQGVGIGALTGLLSGLLGFVLSFAGLAGAEGFLNSYSQYLSADTLKGLGDIPTTSSMLFNLTGVLFNLVFGTLGGWIGATIFNTGMKTEQV